MRHRAFLCLAFSAGVVACFGQTTSLGGPQTDRSTTSSSDDDAGTGVGGSAGGSNSGTETFTSPPDGSTPQQQQWCRWYSWDPVPTTEACQYVLPTPPDSDPGLNPSTWDPHNVRVEFGAKNIGQYVARSADCGDSDGWSYADADGQAPTDFMLCPVTCARVAHAAGVLRLAAKSCH